MSVRNRRPRTSRRTATAIALTAGLTAGAALLLSACGSNDPAANGSAGSPATAGGATTNPGSGPVPAGSASAPAAPSGSPTAGTGKNGPGSTGPASSSAAPLNGTAHNGLTISDGTRYVVMNGTRVDFGTAVRDLSWSPDGKKAAFVDGDGDLAVSRPDGTGRVVVAENPGNQNWSHPAWQVRAADPAYGLPVLDNLQFAVRTSTGASRLYTVPANAAHGTPKVLSLSHESGSNVKELPQTGNVWPNASGTFGDSVYANTADGTIYLRDDNVRQQGAPMTKGSQPASNPAAQGKGTDDGNLVFVRSVGGHDHLFMERSTTTGEVYTDLTPNATTDYTEPAWSPDGKQIAARTPAGIVTLSVTGSHTPVKVSDYKGLPAYRKL